MTARIKTLAALAATLQFLDAQGAQTFLAEIKKLIDAKASSSDITSAVTSALEEYSKTEDINKLIAAAIKQSEDKLYGGDGISEKFDSIKEIADYLENHDDVATAIYAALAQKASKEDLETLEGKVGTLESDVTSLKSGKLDKTTYEADKANFASKSDLENFLTEEDIEDCLTAEDLEELVTPIPTATIQGWFSE